MRKLKDIRKIKEIDKIEEVNKIEETNKTEKNDIKVEKEKINNYKSVKVYIGLFLFVLGIALLITCVWVDETFGPVSTESIIFQLKTPMTGAGGYVIDYLKNVDLLSIAIGLLFFITIGKKLKKNVILISGACSFVAFFVFFSIYLGFFEYVYHQMQTTEIYDEYYVNPEEVDIIFPEEKRNLIYVYMESMENTYKSEEEGGYFEYNLIPNLTKLQRENVSFGIDGKGASIASNCDWTIAAMTAMSAGIPLSIPMGENEYGRWDDFLPGLCNLGDILEREGYTNEICIGSDSSFAGTNHLYEQHGNYKIMDYEKQIDCGYVRDGYFVWWGVEDKKLYGIAKKEILDLASKNEPFNFVMATMDTHTEDGYKCSRCGDEYEEQYANVIKCADMQVYDFVKWVQEQDFYDNTTIIIVGDHLSMDPDFFEEIDDSDYERTIYGVIINPYFDDDSDIIKNLNKERVFNTMDMFPTTLAALGVKIEGDRLGLGTNLFSDKQTLSEMLGTEYINNEILLRSKYYEQKFLKK